MPPLSVSSHGRRRRPLLLPAPPRYQSTATIRAPRVVLECLLEAVHHRRGESRRRRSSAARRSGASSWSPRWDLRDLRRRRLFLRRPVDHADYVKLNAFSPERGGHTCSIMASAGGRTCRPHCNGQEQRRCAAAPCIQPPAPGWEQCCRPAPRLHYNYTPAGHNKCEMQAVSCDSGPRPR